jgi:acetylornithine deacetylase/succinyl-diaminopimelate desuccinylase-like protein
VFETLGLRNVRIDQVGNVLGERPGTGATSAGAAPHLVFSAHLDTVFPEGTDVKVTRQGPGGVVLKGPGIGDDCRGLAVVLGVIRAMNDAGVHTPGTITFVGTVGEEGLGDLRGVKHLFGSELKGRIDRFVSVDGSGYGITNVAVGSKRYRVTFKGPGGHSYGAFGIANPIHALGRAIDAISDFMVPGSPKTTFNVGRVGGGTSVNSIAFEAWAEVDMRSVSPEALGELDARFHKAVQTALAAENARWKGRGAITVDVQLVGDRPAGRLPDDEPVVRAAADVTRALGLPVSLDEGSTDANVPINLRVPAITIDGGGRGTGAHTPDETFDTTDSWKGTQRALLVAIALAGRQK